MSVVKPSAWAAASSAWSYSTECPTLSRRLGSITMILDVFWRCTRHLLVARFYPERDSTRMERVPTRLIGSGDGRPPFGLEPSKLMLQEYADQGADPEVRHQQDAVLWRLSKTQARYMSDLRQFAEFRTGDPCCRSEATTRKGRIAFRYRPLSARGRSLARARPLCSKWTKMPVRGSTLRRYF